MKYKVGDKFVIEITHSSESGLYAPYCTTAGGFVSETYLDKLPMLVNGVEQYSYNKGLEEGWELLKKMYNMDADDFADVFDTLCYEEVLNEYTPQEAKDNIAHWEESNELKAGDIVVSKHTGMTALATRVTENIIYVIYPDGSCGDARKESFEKASGHLPIKELLDEIRGQ